MMETLQCPTCGAPLEYDPRSGSETIRCPFCENTAMLPERARPTAQPQFVSTYASRGARRPTGISANAGFALAVAGALVVAGVVLLIIRATGRNGSSSTRPVGVSNTKNNLAPTKTTGDSYAQPELSFGSEGIGPGNFNDARSVALDADGHIYVGEYSGGRIQVFDPAGKFLTQWTVDRRMPLRGLAADRRGTIYVVQSGEIRRYEGATGKPLGALANNGHAGFDDVVASVDGGLVTVSDEPHDDIVRFDPSGRVTKVIRAAISGQTDNAELNMRVACDGLGQIYALGTFNNAVFKFSPEGKFLTQFGGVGDQPGQFRAPSAIAVDNQGRIYVSDFKGVQVFDANGRYLGLIKVKGAASGLVFNDRNELFVVARTQVYKFPAFKS